MWPLSRYRVCLVRTENPENLGSVARILYNFGFPDLVLVEPRVPPDDPKAILVARRACALLERATIVPTLAEAIAGAQLVVGTTARRGSIRPAITPRALGAELAALPAETRVALVFGPEESGLTTVEADACDRLCSIPTRGPLSSLNLGQAVAVVSWEVSQLDATPAEPERGRASHGELVAFLEHAMDVLEAIRYFDGKSRERVATNLRRILVESRVGKNEIEGLRGVCRQVLWALGRAGGPPGGAPPTSSSGDTSP